MNFVCELSEYKRFEILTGKAYALPVRILMYTAGRVNSTAGGCGGAKNYRILIL